ncbi:amidase family protein [Paraburkholderia fungorum]|uniref:amidase family protein n=1 Tax=Paraburkholderia fungorum TaxID=134537 RepID=UPI0038B995CA
MTPASQHSGDGEQHRTRRPATSFAPQQVVSVGIWSRRSRCLTADDAGVITRTVEDQAIILDVIRGQDTSDAATTIRPQPSTPFVASLDRYALRGKTVAVVDNFDGGNPDVDRITQSAENVLQHSGANIVHITLPKVYEELWSVVMGPVGVAEFRPQFDAYLSTLPNGEPRNMTQFMTVLNALTDNGTNLINPDRYKGLMESYQTKTTASPQIADLRARITRRRLPWPSGST